MENIFSVKDQVVLITGASSGIGRHCALTLAKYGAHLILVGRNEQRLKQVEKKCQQYNVDVLVIKIDITEPDAPKRIIEQSKNKFSHVDVLLNAAGIGMRVPMFELSNEQWSAVMDTNLKSTFFLSQAISEWMIATKTAGRIINISSSAAFYITLTRSVYSASKIAVESITRNLALELAKHKIHVNCIAPGFFVTELTENYLKTDIGKTEVQQVPLARAADLEEFTGVLLLLASKASSYITGSVLHIDGGYAVCKV